MLAHFLAVYVNVSYVITSTEMKNYSSLKLFCAYAYIFCVPDRGHKILIAYSRKVAFGAEGYNDLAVKTCSLFKRAIKPRRALVDFKIPLTVEAEPIFSYTVGTGIFTARDNLFCVHIGIYLQTKYNSLMLT